MAKKVTAYIKLQVPAGQATATEAAKTATTPDTETPAEGTPKTAKTPRTNTTAA